MSGIQQAKVLLSSRTCHMDATAWHLREWAGKGCRHSRPLAHPCIGILRYPGLSGKDGRWEAVCWHPGHELNRNGPCGHSHTRASPFPPVLVFHLRSQHGCKRHTHGSWTVSGGVRADGEVGSSGHHPARGGWPSKQMGSITHPGGSDRTPAWDVSGEKTVNAVTTRACWALKATRSPELTKTLPKGFSNANAC